MPDHDELLGNPNTYATTGFGYLGIQVCQSCWRPNRIFVDSTERHEYCLSCHDEHSTRATGFGELSVRIPNTSTHPILAEQIDTCGACERPFLAGEGRWDSVPAFLSDNETVINVHSDCSRITCDSCVKRHAYTGLRNWNSGITYTISLGQFTGFTIIEQGNHCESCESKFWEEHDNEDYFECECCESQTHHNQSAWFGGSRYCEYCIENNVYPCNDCDELCWDGHDHDCTAEEDDDSSSLIHSYSYKPSPYFFGEGKYHFGFELEVESRGNGVHDGALTVSNTLGAHAYLKEDGSLTSGFEIVTHPHTLENYHKEFNWGVLDKLKSEGFRSWNTSTCGLHVHVSRTAFGEGDPWDRNNRPMRSMLVLKRQSHELRFMKLIYDNQRQVERISGRSSDRYASFEDKGNLVDKVKHGSQGNGRFSAINTENDTTIEVRVFKGSLRKERVLSAIEFVHASVEYTRDVKVTSKNHALSWLKFTGYVASNAELYPNLVTIMSESFAGDDTPNEIDN